MARRRQADSARPTIWSRIVGWFDRKKPPPAPLGVRGERAAERYLKRQGMRIIARNIRLKGGELDLVAREKDVLVFVEVKTRTRGKPEEGMVERKLRRLTAAALAFLHQHSLDGVETRFDFVGVTWPEGAREPIIEHRRNVFLAPRLTDRDAPP